MLLAVHNYHEVSLLFYCFVYIFFCSHCYCLHVPFASCFFCPLLLPFSHLVSSWSLFHYSDWHFRVFHILHSNKKHPCAFLSFFDSCSEDMALHDLSTCENLALFWRFVLWLQTRVLRVSSEENTANLETASQKLSTLSATAQYLSSLPWQCIFIACPKINNFLFMCLYLRKQCEHSFTAGLPRRSRLMNRERMCSLMTFSLLMSCNWGVILLSLA